jgi:hypothetical protein
VAAKAGSKTIIYGRGGMGKSSLALDCPGKTLWIDLEQTLPKLLEERKREFPDQYDKLNNRVFTVEGVETWDDLLAVLDADIYEGVENVVLDSLTRADSLCVSDVCEKVAVNKEGKLAESIADYGFGVGFQHVYDRFRKLVALLDRHVQSGRNIVLIAHEIIDDAKSRDQEDFTKTTIRMTSSKKVRVRDLVIEFTENLVLIDYAGSIEDKRPTGRGMRQIVCTSRPAYDVKLRGQSATDIPYRFGQGQAFWELINNTTEKE